MSRKLLIVLPLLTLGVAGCDSGRPIAITEKRTLSPKEQEVAVGATSAQRFQLVRQMMGMETEGAHEGHDHADNAPLAFQTPEGWKREEASQFRTVNFSFGENGEGECYVSRVGGGLEANLNRWRGQMGLEPATAEEIQALPKKMLFGLESTYVELEGDFKGVGASEAKKNYRMVGLILSLPDVSFFVKMTGPKELLIENQQQFDKFTESLRLERGGQHE